jgi:choline-sulfatase
MLAPGRWADTYDPDDIAVPDWLDLSPAGRPVAEQRLDESAFFRHYDRYDWTEGQYREVLAAYYGQVSMIDHGVGRILDALESEGLRDETIVAFTADHGDHNGQFGWFHKGTMYDGAARVPFIVDDPAGASGVETDHVVNTLGLFRTILDRAGVDAPPTHSRSLAPLLADPDTDDWDEETYSELGSQAAVVREDYKLVRAETEGDVARYELYDRGERPHDATNLWGDPDHADAASDLEARLRELHATYGDPGE